MPAAEHSTLLLARRSDARSDRESLRRDHARDRRIKQPDRPGMLGIRVAGFSPAPLPWYAGDSPNPAPDQPPATQMRHDDRSTLTPSILVVDDEPGICSIVEEMLTDEGYRVRIATSGAAALALCAQEIPQLLLCDQMMPGMTGEELCRQLRKDPRYATMRMILMSAASEASIRGNNQVDAFLKKPFHMDRLVLLIGDVLDTDHNP